ncbi:MAG: PDDEXK nuclease domain-containing protein [Lactococcus sp.]|uniref:PDDEXK nuclease domain-containing protein n=1 Tax=Lactococcus sp. TaxID=44273 RepID=UPI002FCAB191
MNQKEYLMALTEIKSQIRTAQYKAVLGANFELICLYWNIGNVINANSSWGNKFTENLAKDIKYEFPDVKGYSVRNLKYMAKFASEFNWEIVQTVSAQLTWSHNVTLMDKVKDKNEREWYAKKSLEHGWSVNVLTHEVELDLYKRQVASGKTTNFALKLPECQSDLALQTLKDPYIFDFIEAREDLREADLEKELVKNITKLLLELGTGFAFVGNQYHLEVGGESFYLDLLFYHLNLRAYIVVELKTGAFKPEYAGKLNFYLSAVDGILKKETDNPSIGILLCKSKNKVIAEYALKDMKKPIGVSEYKLTNSLPKEFKNLLPSADDIETRISLD